MQAQNLYWLNSDVCNETRVAIGVCTTHLMHNTLAVVSYLAKNKTRTQSQVSGLNVKPPWGRNMMVKAKDKTIGSSCFKEGNTKDRNGESLAFSRASSSKILEY